MGLEFYLISTSHLEDDLWFREESDFKEGMNAVAVTVCLTRIQILAFILMSNHVHFVVQGTREESLRFITLFKRQYSSYLRRKYGVKEALRGNAVDIRQVKLEDESLQRAIAYVLMNCVSANICVHSSLYPWGRGRSFSIHSLQKAGSWTLFPSVLSTVSCTHAQNCRIISSFLHPVLSCRNPMSR